jgi:hypothetical protein
MGKVGQNTPQAGSQSAHFNTTSDGDAPQTTRDLLQRVCRTKDLTLLLGRQGAMIQDREPHLGKLHELSCTWCIMIQ